MVTPTSRYRSDLIELAWSIERKYGLPPGADESLGSSSNGAEGSFGLITGGVTLPDPTYEWEPFYGVGVVDRNFNFPVQGREILEGSIPTIYLTHDNSRLALEQIMGLIFNNTEVSAEASTVTTTSKSLNDASSATFEADDVKNVSGWASGASAMEVLEETNGGGTGSAADEANAHDDTAATLAISFDDITDRLYIGSPTPFTQVRIDVGGTPNSVVATLAVEYSTISGAYIAGSIVQDGTSIDSKSFAIDGIIVLDPPPNWGRTPEGSGADNRYWIRLNFGSATITTGTLIVDIDIYTGVPTHVVIIGQPNDSDVEQEENIWKDTFAYIGPPKGTTVAAGTEDTDGEFLINVFSDRGLTRPGWHGKAPSTSGSIKYSIHNIERIVTTSGILPDATSKILNVRETLVQQSFTIGARFTAEDGARFTTNYTGNKISRSTFNFEEGRPVTYSLDFIAQDVRHDLGAAATELKFSGDVVNPTFRQVNEQPYFFSRAELRFDGTAFARFRRLSLSIDNQLDPRYYVTQGNTIDNRQTLFEILEGRRQISLTGSVDLDDRVADAQFMRWLLNQGFTDADVRDMATLEGITLVIELERLIDGSGPTFDRITFTLPSGTLGANNVGLIFRRASHPIPAPPDVHHTIDLDMIASSVQIVIDDSTS